MKGPLERVRFPGSAKGFLGQQRSPLDRERLPWAAKGPSERVGFPWSAKGSLGPRKGPLLGTSEGAVRGPGGPGQGPKLPASGPRAVVLAYCLLAKASVVEAWGTCLFEHLSMAETASFEAAVGLLQIALPSGIAGVGS